MYRDIIVAGADDASFLQRSRLRRLQSIEVGLDFELEWLVGALDGVREPHHPNAYHDPPVLDLERLCGADSDDDEGPWVDAFPERLVTQLAGLNAEDVSRIGTRWGQLALERTNAQSVDIEEFIALRSTLVTLARAAKAAGKTLLMRTSL